MALRTVFFRHPLQQAVRRKYRIEKPWVKKDGSISHKPSVFYPCYICEGHFKGTEVNLDHVDPVVNIKTGFVDWNTFIARLFGMIENLTDLQRPDSLDNFRLVCKPCHKEKSLRERRERKEVRLTSA